MKLPLVISLLFSCVLLFSIPLLQAEEPLSEESISITTYYPSPYGSYRDLEIHRSIKYTPQTSSDTVSDPEEGQMIYLHTASQQGFYFYDGSDWQPVTGSGGSTDPLVNSQHTQKDCTSAGGTVIDSDVGFPICKFIASSCPTNWTQYKDYSATDEKSCYSYRVVPPGYKASGKIQETGAPCSTGEHNFSNTPQETCAYSGINVGYGVCYCDRVSSSGCSGLCPGSCTCEADITQVGCY